MIYSGMQYFVITFSISASPISSDLAWHMGTVIETSFFLIYTKVLWLVKSYCVIEFQILKVSG